MYLNINLIYIYIKNKIEKYENCDVKELNADQITTIKKKSEVSSLIKEFEDLHKQYTLFDQQVCFFFFFFFFF